MKKTIRISVEEYSKLLEASKRITYLASDETQPGDNLKTLETFRKKDVDKMFKVLQNSKDYFKNGIGLWMKKRDLCILATLVYMGLRPREACYLKFSDINLIKGYAYIDRNNNKQKKPRVVPIPKSWMPYFKSFTKMPKYFWENSEYLFPSHESKVLSPGQWKRIMREKILKPSKLWLAPEDKNPAKTKFRSYTLRHYFMQEMLRKSNGDLNAVATLAGHADLRTIKKYLNFNDDYLSKLSEIMNKK